MADLIITLLFYAFCLAGSVTIGYILLRLTYPDVRTMEHNQKLGASAATGAALLILPLIISTLTSGIDGVLELTTPLFLFTAILFLIAFGALKTYFYLAKPQYVNIAIPLPVAPAGRENNQATNANLRSSTSGSMSVIRNVEIQTAPKSSLEKLARSATEGTTVIDVPIRKEDTTPQQLPTFEMIIPNKGDSSVATASRKTSNSKTEIQMPAPNKTQARSATEKNEYVSMASPDANNESTPSWRRKRDSTVTAAPSTSTQAPSIAMPTPQKQDKKEEAKPTPQVTGDWRRPRDGSSRAATTEKPLDEVDAILADVVKETKVKAQTQVQKGAPVHRRYLLGKDTVEVIAPNGTANNAEFNEMIQDVYSQLKTAKTTSVAATPQADAKTDAKQVENKTTKTSDKKTTGTNAPAKPAGELSIQDILGGSNDASGANAPTENSVFAQLDSANPGEGVSLFGQLSEISGGRSPSATASAAKKAPDVANVKIAAEKDMACPTCRTKNTRIVFCPYCGSGMCANCSPKIKPVGPGQFLYTCPKCQEEVNVKTR